RREDEVALGETVDLVRPDRHADLAPGEQNVRVMSLLLGEVTDLVGEGERRLEVGELEGLLEVVLVDHVPGGELGAVTVELGAFERGHAAAARHASFGSEVAGGRGVFVHRYSLTRASTKSGIALPHGLRRGASR